MIYTYVLIFIQPSLGEGDLAVTGEKISIRCPITQQIMKHPLQNIHCGHCYDRQGVEGIIRNRKEKARLVMLYKAGLMV